MPSSSILLGAVLSTLSTTAFATQYTLNQTFTAANWLDAFKFETYDYNQGYVNYLTEPAAKAAQIYKVVNGDIQFGAEAKEVLNPTGAGRKSVRLEGKTDYNYGLFIIDIKNMPSVCGMWPSFWSLGREPWPVKGEIDMIEGVNLQTINKINLHTDTTCKVDGLGQSGKQIGYECSEQLAGTAGCETDDTRTTSYGAGFNSKGGGVYAMEWDNTAIRTWFFPRGTTPASITNGAPDTATFGTPVANYKGGCNIAARFKDHRFIFTNNFCGEWAGEVYSQSTCPKYYDAAGKPLTSQAMCRQYVAKNPTAFTNAFWRISSFKTYKKKVAVVAAKIAVPSSSAAASSSAVVSKAPTVASSAAVVAKPAAVASSSAAVAKAPASASTPSVAPKVVVASSSAVAPKVAVASSTVVRPVRRLVVAANIDGTVTDDTVSISIDASGSTDDVVNADGTTMDSRIFSSTGASESTDETVNDVVNDDGATTHETMTTSSDVEKGDEMTTEDAETTDSDEASDNAETEDGTTTDDSEADDSSDVEDDAEDEDDTATDDSETTDSDDSSDDAENEDETTTDDSSDASDDAEKDDGTTTDDSETTGSSDASDDANKDDVKKHGDGKADVKKHGADKGDVKEHGDEYPTLSSSYSAAYPTASYSDSYHGYSTDDSSYATPSSKAAPYPVYPAGNNTRAPYPTGKYNDYDALYPTESIKPTEQYHGHGHAQYHQSEASKTAVTKTLTYVDVCETGYTTITTTQTSTYGATPTNGFKVTTKVCSQGCGSGPKTVTVTIPADYPTYETGKLTTPVPAQPTTTLYSTIDVTVTSQIYETKVVTVHKYPVPASEYYAQHSSSVPSKPSASSKPYAPVYGDKPSYTPSVGKPYTPVYSKPAQTPSVYKPSKPAQTPSVYKPSKPAQPSYGAVYPAKNATLSYSTGAAKPTASKTGYYIPEFTGAATGLQAGGVVAGVAAFAAFFL